MAGMAARVLQHRGRGGERRPFLFDEIERLVERGARVGAGHLARKPGLGHHLCCRA
jgi:hypothetical protein